MMNGKLVNRLRQWGYLLKVMALSFFGLSIVFTASCTEKKIVSAKNGNVKGWWKVYTPDNSGLPRSSYGVVALAIDLQGNIWIGVEAGVGLTEFDGEDWRVYNTRNSGLPDDNVWCLAVDLQGNLWIGTWGGGLAKFDGENWIVYKPIIDTNITSPPVMWESHVWSIAIDPWQNVWVGIYNPWGTKYGGLAKFDGKDWKVYDVNNSGLPYDWIDALAVDLQGNVWVGT